MSPTRTGDQSYDLPLEMVAPKKTKSGERNDGVQGSSRGPAGARPGIMSGRVQN